jgi:hypothetical protein
MVSRKERTPEAQPRYLQTRPSSDRPHGACAPVSFYRIIPGAGRSRFVTLPGRVLIAIGPNDQVPGLDAGRRTTGADGLVSWN